MSVDSSQRYKWIKENAYFRWVDDGYPDGQALRNWLESEVEYMFSTLEAELDTIRKRQLNDLLIHRHIFRQFADATQPYVGSQDGVILADWIARNYVAFAATAVRRMLDRRHDAHSLVRLIHEVQRNCTKFTRQRMRQKYVDSLPVEIGV